MKILALADLKKINFKKEIFVYPTETAYGIGAACDQLPLLEKILLIKKRPAHKVFPVIASSFSQVKEWFYFSKEEERLAKKYWPGPLTILLKPKKNLPIYLLGQEGRVGVRVSGNVVARKLARLVKKPIVATSANLSGKGNSYDPRQIWEDFYQAKYQPDWLIDFGLLPENQSSTVLLCHDDGRLEILRQGGVTLL
ncbi:MAG TPA: L-threonylcarbamoyladenylate synthase [bacterium]|nr:L-threonylcarbamoyladenylate synthase [bacterium]